MVSAWPQIWISQLKTNVKVRSTFEALGNNESDLGKLADLLAGNVEEVEYGQIDTPGAPSAELMPFGWSWSAPCPPWSIILASLAPSSEAPLAAEATE